MHRPSTGNSASGVVISLKLACYTDGNHTRENPEGMSLMSDSPDKPRESGSVIDMPWVLISNQIQQLNTSMNQRFTDERARMDDRFAALEKRMDDRFAQVDQRFQQIDQRFEQIDQRFQQIDQRFEAVDQRLNRMEHRLEFRMSIWVSIIIALLTALLGFFVAHGPL